MGFIHIYSLLLTFDLTRKVTSLAYSILTSLASQYHYLKSKRSMGLAHIWYSWDSIKFEYSYILWSRDIFTRLLVANTCERLVSQRQTMRSKHFEKHSCFVYFCGNNNLTPCRNNLTWMGETHYASSTPGNKLGDNKHSIGLNNFKRFANSH